jgi:hypothetical protein
VITFTDHPDQIRGAVQGGGGVSPPSLCLDVSADPEASDCGRFSRRVHQSPIGGGHVQRDRTPDGDLFWRFLKDADWLDWLNPRFCSGPPESPPRAGHAGQPTTCTLTIKQVPQ